MSEMNIREGTNNLLRLLIIDDNPDDRMLVIRELRKEFEIHVQEIADEEGFAGAMEEGNFDLVITDYQLRWSNGLEVLGKMKALQPDCLVIMFTGTGNEEIAVEAMKNDLDDYVIKSPKHFIRLPAAVKAAMKKVQERQEMRKAQEALRENEEKYRSLVDSTEDSIYLVDRECRYLFMNEKYLSRFGLPGDKVMGRGYGEFHPEGETKEFAGKVKAVFETGESLSYEYRSERDSGFYIRTLSPVEVLDRKTTAVTVVSKDITERKRVEEALRKYEQDKVVILDTMSEHVVYRDMKMKVLWANRAAGESVGLSPEQLVGRHCYEIWHQRSEQCVVCPAKETLKTGQRGDAEVTTPDGRVWWIRTYPIRDANRDIVGIANVTLEITERKRAEQEQRRLEAQFQQAQRMEALGTLSGGIAHDFNNILMGIQGNASLILVDKTSGHPDYERLKNIEQGVQSGAELTKQLLSFTRGGKYEVKPADLNEIIKRTSDMFGRTKKEITIHRKLQEGIWPVEVDQGQIEQVLLNI